MITITNISPPGTPLTGWHDYEICVGGNPICQFSHHRASGLADLFKKASNAVKRHGMEQSTTLSGEKAPILRAKEVLR